MLKKFMGGLVFGAGFSIAFIAVWFVVSVVIFPAYFESKISDAIDSEVLIPNVDGDKPGLRYSFGSDVPFHTLSIEEQIAAASAITLAKYEPADDGRMQAIIKEFLKLKPGTDISYDVGDEHSGSSYYPGGEGGRGDGIIIFFTGSPAVMQMSTSFYGDRITGLGDIPLELFREKCTDEGA